MIWTDVCLYTARPFYLQDSIILSITYLSKILGISTFPVDQQHPLPA